MKENNLLAELAAYLFKASDAETSRTPSERELAEHFSVSRGQIREALAIIAEGGGTPAGIVIALDRQERVREDAAQSAAQAGTAEHGIPVVAVAGLGDLLEFAGERAELVGHRDALLAYRARYGIGE